MIEQEKKLRQDQPIHCSYCTAVVRVRSTDTLLVLYGGSARIQQMIKKRVSGAFNGQHKIFCGGKTAMSFAIATRTKMSCSSPVQKTQVVKEQQYAARRGVGMRHGRLLVASPQGGFEHKKTILRKSNNGARPPHQQYMKNFELLAFQSGPTATQPVTQTPLCLDPRSPPHNFLVCSTIIYTKFKGKRRQLW